MFKITIALAATIALAGTPLFAADGSWQVGHDQIHVIDSKLDVSTSAGRALLLTHIEKAAQRLCRDRVGHFREDCETETLRTTATGASTWSKALALALQERGSTRMAVR